MAYRIVFPTQNRVELETFTVDQVADGALRMRTSFSLMSTGTEGIVLHGLFDENTHWAKFADYPFHPGYSAVGVVEEVGPNVEGFVVGDRVAARAGHASEHVLCATSCTGIPGDIPMEQACWFGLAKIALIGARAAAYQLGDTVAVIGAGPIGQMSIRWAAAAGATRVVAVDTLESRLDLARRGGATAVVGSPVAEGVDDVIRACGGKRPRVVVDTTGNAIAFAGALGLVADHGRLILLGDTGSPASQHLTSDVVLRGITVVGAHDSHSMSAPWDADRSFHEIFFDLVSAGRFNLDELNTHIMNPTDGEAAYGVADVRRGETMGIVFDWSQL